MEKLDSPLGKYNVANRLEKRSLLIAVNLVAGLSIFFFGYDQGVMGGVNQSRSYAEIMGFGHWTEADGVVVDKTLLQGGIVRFSPEFRKQSTHANVRCRTLSTTFLVHSSAVSWAAGLATSSDAFALSNLEPCGLL